MKKYSEFLKVLQESKIEEASGKNFIDVYDEDKAFAEPIYRVHRNDVIEEIKELLLGKENGYLQRITIFANLPSHGKNKPSYLADTLPKISQPEEGPVKPGSEEEPNINWSGADVDPEDDEIVISGDEGPVDTEIDWKEAGIEWDKEEEEPEGSDDYEDEEDLDDEDDDEDEDSDDSKKSSGWVDSEFEVVDVDETNNLVVAMPYSMRRKGITTPILPRYIDEIYYKKVKRNAP
jgi:hypothetical protein